MKYKYLQELKDKNTKLEEKIKNIENSVKIKNDEIDKLNVLYNNQTFTNI